jgi:hypothetical protein
MFEIYVNESLVGTKEFIDSAKYSFSNLVSYFKKLKENYIKMGLNIDEKVIKIVETTTGNIIEKISISDL